MLNDSPSRGPWRRLAFPIRPTGRRAWRAHALLIPVLFSKSIEVAVTWAAGSLADAQILPRLGERAARTELVRLIRLSLKPAANAAPSLAPDLRSPVFLNQVLAPAVLDALRSRNTALSAGDLARGYVGRFLQPFLQGRDPTATLTHVFRLTPEQFVAVFEVFLIDLRPRLYASKHWREPIQDSAIEEIRTGVLGLVAAQAAPPAPAHDLDTARQDARDGSESLRSWSQRIKGLYLERPELAALRERILTTPAASTLLVGAAGSGKSALLAGLTQQLEADGLTVFAIKADLLPPDVMSLKEVSRALSMQGDIVAEIDALAQSGPVVVIIDQLDAVSEIMDRTSHRMTLLLQLATRWGDRRHRPGGPLVHVVISSRPFEAHHDARFQTLGAETVELALPPYEKVEALLRDLGIDPALVAEGLEEPLRRPFRLKLFVDIALRGGPLGGLVDGELLNAWLASAQLGDDAARAEVAALLVDLAEEMTATETLWRPADRFTAQSPRAVQRAEACELIVRKGETLGFAHQTWLDDFQARGFLTARCLAEHAWRSQGGLFGRATILRALERMRSMEPEAYSEALDALLGDARTRRHLRHLVADVIAMQDAPQAREIAWVQRLLREDRALGVRAVNKVVERWAGWREPLAPMIPGLHADGDIARIVLTLAIEEARSDPVAGDTLLTTIYAAPEQDDEAWEIAWRAALWSPTVRDRVVDILKRTPVSDRWIAHFATTLAEAGRAADGAELLGLYLAQLDPDSQPRQELYGLEKIYETAPLAYAQAVLPWFLKMANTAPETGARNAYPRAYGLPYEWQEDTKNGNALGGFQTAINGVAKTDPKAFLELASGLSGYEMDDVQSVVAEGFAAGDASLTAPAIDWLLEDPRRLNLGWAHAVDDDGLFGAVQGYSTAQFLDSVGPRATPDELQRLVAAIEAWDRYTPEAYAETDAEERRDMRRQTEDHRARLLVLLPLDALSPRRRRQVVEQVRADRRPLKGRRAARRISDFARVGMTAEQMALATDDQLFAMFDKVSDAGVEGDDGRREFHRGGSRELSLPFATFAKAHPARAMALAEDRFKAGRQERVAGAMVRDLSGQDGVDAEALLALIRTLLGRGFASDGWRRDVGWALENIANSLSGLDDGEIALLESWLETDPAVLQDQTTRRRLNDEANRDRNRPKEPKPAEAALFGPGGRRFGSIPQGNNTYLAAIGAGLTRRIPPAHDAWLHVLERHVERPDDPAIWSYLLARYGWSLHHADKARVEVLIRRIFADHPEAFGVAAALDIWRLRQLIPPDLIVPILQAWIAEREEGLQVAAEYAMAATLIDPPHAGLTNLSAALQGRDDDLARAGGLFAAAAVWREMEGEPRTKAHGVLLATAAEADGPIADAISTAIDATRNLRADMKTRALLVAARDNLKLLKACLTHWFADSLQDLLLHPGFEQLVLEIATLSADLLLADAQRLGSSLIDQDFVAIAIALQRRAEPLRSQAMDLYETLLDAGVYGADQAARASLQR